MTDNYTINITRIQVLLLCGTILICLVMAIMMIRDMFGITGLFQ